MNLDSIFATDVAGSSRDVNIVLFFEKESLRDDVDCEESILEYGDADWVSGVKVVEVKQELLLTLGKFKLTFLSYCPISALNKIVLNKCCTTDCVHLL